VNVMSAAEAHYTSSEVLWLLGLSEQTARDLDDSPPSFLGNVSAEGPPPGGSADEQLPVIARWHDVQRAKRGVLARAGVEGRRQAVFLQLRAKGYSEELAARIVEVSRSSARRANAGFVDAVLEELGGAAPPRNGEPVPTCAGCGSRPAAQSRPVRKRVKGEGLVVVKPSRQLSLCEGCIPVGIAREVLPRYDRYREAA